MAETIQLSSAVSTQNEPKRKCRWLLYFPRRPQINIEWTGDNLGADGTPQSGGTTRTSLTTDLTTDLTFAAHTAARPSWSYNVVEVHRLHERFRFAGKIDWNEMSLSFYDFTSGQSSVGQILWDWSSAIYNPLDGTMGYAGEYKVDGSLAMLDPHGNTAQQFNLFGFWPTSVDFQDLSYEDDGAAEIQCAGRFDFATKNQDVAIDQDALTASV